MPKNDTEAQETAVTAPTTATAISSKLHGKALIAPAFTLVTFIGWRLSPSLSPCLLLVHLAFEPFSNSSSGSSIIFITINILFLYLFRSM